MSHKVLVYAEVRNGKLKLPSGETLAGSTKMMGIKQNHYSMLFPLWGKL